YKNQRNEVVPALYEKPLSGRAQEIMNGVSDLQIEYGICDINFKNVLQYEKANEINNWQQVCAVSLAVTVRSLEPILHRTVKIKDRYLYQTWHSYIALRELS